jgi:hypothetical protein
LQIRAWLAPEISKSGRLEMSRPLENVIQIKAALPEVMRLFKNDYLSSDMPVILATAAA